MMELFRKAVSGVMLILMLVGVFASAFDLQRVRCESVITIVVPGTAGQNPPPDSWVDSGVSLSSGDSVTITATGSVSWDGVNWAGPDGDPSWPPGNGFDNPVLPGAPVAALIAKIGGGPIFLVGSGPTAANGEGQLIFAVNDQTGAQYNNVGSFTVTIIVSPSPPASHTVFFEESGVGNPAQVWSVTLDGYGTEYSNGPGNTIYTIVFNGVASGGPYQFTVMPPSGFVAQPTADPITVNGGDFHQPITFTSVPVTYIFTVAAGSGGSVSYSFGLGSGTVSSGQSQQLTVPQSCQFSITGNPDSLHVFQTWSTTGSVSVYDASSASTTATVNGNGAVMANFAYNLVVSIIPESASIKSDESVTFTATASGGSGGYTYAWYWVQYGATPPNHGSQNTGASNKYTFTPSSSGDYGIYVIVTDSGGNTAQSLASSVTVTPPAATYYTVTFTESGLPLGVGWSVSFNSASLPFNTKSSSSNSIAFSVPNDNYYYSVAPPVGYTIPPSQAIGTVTVEGQNINMPEATFSLSPAEIKTEWSPVKDSYIVGNPTNWAWYRGMCYGMSSTALMYFMRYTLSNKSYPTFPSQSSTAHSTSYLVFPTSWPWETVKELNNASLAVMFNQVYIMPHFAPGVPLFHLPEWENQQFIDLLANLTSKHPVVLNIGKFPPLVPPADRGWYHAVVAVGAKPETALGVPTGIVDIYIYDPSHPQTTKMAKYDTIVGSFSYSDPEGSSYNTFYVVSPSEALPHDPVTPENYLGDWWEMSIPYWLAGSVTDYNIVIADKDKPVTVTAVSSNLEDKFDESGMFVCGIAGSSGIEEGNVQVYAIPSDIDITVSDPGSCQSGLLITRVANESGQLVGYGCLVNATATHGPLNFTVTPSDSGLSISVGANALNASVTIFSATMQDHSVFQVQDIPVGAMQTANFTVTDWQTLNSTGPLVSFSPTLYFAPDPMNLKGNGKWVTVYLNLPQGYDVSGIKVSSIKLNGTVSVDTTAPIEMGILGNGTVPHLMVSFERTAVSDFILSKGIMLGNVTLEIAGQLSNGTSFEYSATIKVRMPGDVNMDGTVNAQDAVIMGTAFGSKLGTLAWNQAADENEDGYINAKDVVLVGQNFGKTYP